MKKSILCTLAILGFMSLNAQKNVVKVNPVGLIFGSAQLGYERVLTDKSAIEISASYTRLDVTFDNSTSQTDINGFGAEGKYKLYFSSSKDAPRGWYAAPLVNYSNISGDSGDSEGSVSIFGAGAVAGYQWVFGRNNSGFSLDLNLGAQYASISTDGNITSTDVDSVIPRLGIAIGYAF